MRKHVKTWRRVATWLYSTYNGPWPRTIEQFIEYIMHRVAEPCGKSIPTSLMKTSGAGEGKALQASRVAEHLGGGQPGAGEPSGSCQTYGRQRRSWRACSPLLCINAIGEPRRPRTRLLTDLPLRASFLYNQWPQLDNQGKYLGPLPRDCGHNHKYGLAKQPFWTPAASTYPADMDAALAAAINKVLLEAPNLTKPGVERLGEKGGNEQVRVGPCQEGSDQGFHEGQFRAGHHEGDGRVPQGAL